MMTRERMLAGMARIFSITGPGASVPASWIAFNYNCRAPRCWDPERGRRPPYSTTEPPF